MRPSTVLLTVLFALSLALITAVYDGGYYRFNRVQRSDTLKKVETFTLSAINTNHFLDLSSTRLESQSTQSSQSTPSWSHLFNQLDLSQHELFSLAEPSVKNVEPNFFSLSTESTNDQHFIPLSIPEDSQMHKFTQQFYDKLQQSPWGGAQSWSSSTTNTPQGKIISHEPEPLPFQHPQTSQFTLQLNQHQQLLFQMDWSSTGFARPYSPKIQQHDPATGRLVKQTSPIDHNRYCFFTATIVGAYDTTSTPSTQSTTPLTHISALTNNFNAKASSFSMQSLATNVPFFEPTLSLPQSSAESQSYQTQSTTPQLSTNFPELGKKYSFNTCRGGYEGIFSYQNTLYQVLPLLNHVSITEAAFIMSQLENQTSITTPDLNSIHIVFDASQPSYNFYENYVKELQDRGLNVQGDDDLMTHMCASGRLNPVQRPTGRKKNKQTTQSVKSSPYEEFRARLNDDHDHDHDHDEYQRREEEQVDLYSVLSATTSTLINKYYNYQEQQRLNNAMVYQSDSFTTQQSTSSSQRYIELLFVHDARRVSQLGAPAALQHGAQLAQIIGNFMDAHNSMSNPTLNYLHPVALVLVDQLAFTADPWNVTNAPACTACSSPDEVSVDWLLQEFNRWRASPATTVPPHDNAHLLSGLDFQSSVLGYAGVNTMCSTQASSGINQVMTTANSDFSSIVIMHEMHHNLSSSHDGDHNTCPSGVHVMSPSLSQASTTGTFRELSSCSMNYVNSNLASYTCLTNVPQYSYGQPRCGNGIVETGEECDCGKECASDPCCDASTCKLQPTALIGTQVITPQCSLTQDCCDSQCQIKEKGIVCQPATGACDIQETCDGVSGSCPNNTTKGSAFECTAPQSNNALGKCYMGTCITEQGACNALGTNLSACQTDTHVIGPTDSRWCSNKQCLVNGSCGIMAQGASQDALPWDDGIPCGQADSGRQCYQGKCVDLNTYAAQFQWVYSDWQPCSVCGEPQLRTATCTDKLTQTFPANEQLCSEPTAVKESLVRACNSVQLGCVYDYSEEEKAQNKGKIYFFGVWTSSVIIAMIFVGVVAFWAIIAFFCYQCITRPVDGKKDSSGEELTEEQQNRVDDKLDAAEHKKEEKARKKAKKMRKNGQGRADNDDDEVVDPSQMSPAVAALYASQNAR